MAELSSRFRGLPSSSGLLLAVLHGSRARGDGGPAADWDIAVRGATDPAGLAAGVADIVGTDAVDIVDLDRASALLRYRVARDGVLLAGEAEEFERFRLAAISFWCDAGPVIRAAQEEVLAGLG